MTECNSTSDLSPRLTSVWGELLTISNIDSLAKPSPGRMSACISQHRWNRQVARDQPARALLWEPGKEVHGGLTLLEDMLGAGVGDEMLPCITRVHKVCRTVQSGDTDHARTDVSRQSVPVWLVGPGYGHGRPRVSRPEPRRLELDSLAVIQEALLHPEADSLVEAGGNKHMALRVPCHP